MEVEVNLSHPKRELRDGWAVALACGGRGGLGDRPRPLARLGPGLRSSPLLSVTPRVPRWFSSASDAHSPADVYAELQHRTGGAGEVSALGVPPGRERALDVNPETQGNAVGDVAWTDAEHDFVGVDPQKSPDKVHSQSEAVRYGRDNPGACKKP
jgi:hypothetical protein